jgi:hypothetical protein
LKKSLINTWAVTLTMIMLLPMMIIFAISVSLKWIGEKLDKIYYKGAEFRQKAAPFYFEKYHDPEGAKRANEDL